MKSNRKIIVFVLILLALAFITTAIAVTALNSKSKMSTLISDEENWSVGRMEEIINTCQSVPLGELHCYSFEEISRFAGNRGIVVNLNSVGTTLS